MAHRATHKGPDRAAITPHQGVSCGPTSVAFQTNMLSSLMGEAEQPSCRAGSSVGSTSVLGIRLKGCMFSLDLALPRLTGGSCLMLRKSDMSRSCQGREVAAQEMSGSGNQW